MKIPRLARVILSGLLLMCVAASARAQEDDGNPANWCRNGHFPSYKTEFKQATVGGNWTARIHFLNDDDGCPSPEVRCETKRYLITGDKVLVSKTYGQWMCAWYQPQKGSETVGWLRADKLIVAAPPAPL